MKKNDTSSEKDEKKMSLIEKIEADMLVYNDEKHKHERASETDRTYKRKRLSPGD